MVLDLIVKPPVAKIVYGIGLDVAGGEHLLS
jgi:hypothetical protein